MNARIVAAALLLGVAGRAPAAIVTLTGTDFNLVYDDTELGQFGTPSLIGDNIFFTPNSFRATSTNGTGVVTDDSTANGLELVAHAGFQFNTLSVSEFGDYLMTGASSTVSVTGQLRAFDLTNPVNTQTSGTITPSALTPLTTIDATSHDWVASASISNLSQTIIPPAFGGEDPWLTDADRVGLTLENLLTAYTTTAGDSGALQATIEKKFNGVEISVNPVPISSTLWLLGSGLSLLALLSKRPILTYG